MRKRRLEPYNPLSEQDKERIAKLAGDGKRRTPGRIAQLIGKNTSTVYWHMLRNGLVERAPDKNRRAVPYQRNGRTVYPYGAAEDAFIQKRRADGLAVNEIAAEATEKFGNPRTGHSIFVRLTILAATVEKDAA